MGNLPVLKIDLMLKDRILKSYVFTQDRIEIGRIPTADIFIDNSAISRAHTRIEKSVQGPFIVKDLGSTNGTYVNDEQISEATLNNDDVIYLGKFALKVTIDEADLASMKNGGVSADAFEGTTVLSQTQLSRLSAKLQHEEQKQADSGGAASGPAAEPLEQKRSRLVWWVIGAVIIVAVGLFLIL